MIEVYPEGTPVILGERFNGYITSVVLTRGMVLYEVCYWDENERCAVTVHEWEITANAGADKRRIGFKHESTGGSGDVRSAVECVPAGW